MRVGIGVLVGAGRGVRVCCGVSTGSGAGLGATVGAGEAVIGATVSPGAIALVGAGAAGTIGCLGKRESKAIGLTITVALELFDGAFEALIVIVLVQGPGAIAVKVTSITMNVFGASEPMLESVKPPGDRHPPPTMSLSTTLLAIPSPRFP
jgi:hypothetical protein